MDTGTALSELLQPAWPVAGPSTILDNAGMEVDEGLVADSLRHAGACFAFVHGSRVTTSATSANSDLDVGAWWPGDAPASWEVDVPSYVDLVVLNTAPLWLAGRIAQYGRLLFEDDISARVAWQADTRLRFLDEIPAVRRRYSARLDQIAQLASRKVTPRHG